MSRRKVGSILPLELQILEAALTLQARQHPVYGFALARQLEQDSQTTGLTSHGTLYKALSRMTTSKLLEAAWEADTDIDASSRPRRRLYSVTGAGELALKRHRVLEVTRTNLDLGSVLS